MDEEKEQEQQQENEQSVEDVIRNMKAEHDEEIAKKDKEIADLKTAHAKAIRDILTGRDENYNKEKTESDAVKEMAKKIRKNLGV